MSLTGIWIVRSEAEALGNHLAAADGHAHRRCHGAQRDAGAADQRFQQHVGGTGQFARPAAGLVQPGRGLAVPGVHHDGDVVAIEPALGAGRDARRVRLVAIQSLQWRLSGAQFVSTDYPEPDRHFSEYRVRLPGGVVARRNPVSGDPAWGDIDLESGQAPKG